MPIDPDQLNKQIDVHVAVHQFGVMIHVFPSLSRIYVGQLATDISCSCTIPTRQLTRLIGSVTELVGPMIIVRTEIVEYGEDKGDDKDADQEL